MIARDRILALGVALLLHVLAATVAVLLRVSDPAVRRDIVELRFRLEREKEEPPLVVEQRDQRERTVSPSAPPRQKKRDVPTAAAPEPRGESRDQETPVRLPSPRPSADSNHARRVMEIRSVLDRKVSAEEAWDVLGELLEEYPQFRETVMREMIAGAGLPPDSLPRADMRYEQMFRDGMRPSWGRQREVVEHAFRSFDPVHGWMNKGGYGPAVNVLGLLKFLIDLIEGDD